MSRKNAENCIFFEFGGHFAILMYKFNVTVSQNLIMIRNYLYILHQRGFLTSPTEGRKCLLFL